MKFNKKPVRVVFSKRLRGETLTDSYITTINYDALNYDIENKERRTIKRKLLADPDIFLVNVYDNEELELKGVVDKDDKLAGPYLAMYYYRYMGYEWVNWDNESEPSLQLLQSITQENDWEEYAYSIIVKEGTTPERLDDIIKNLGYNIDYVLERNNGLVNILHQTEYIEELKANGYTLTDVEHGEGNYSFGRGLYCLDKDNFDDTNTGWKDREDVYTGVYQGEYLRCIEDIGAGLKNGEENKFQQEILIPFTERNIVW